MMKRTSVLDFLGVVRIVGYSLAIVPALIAVVLYLIGHWLPLAASIVAPFLGPVIAGLLVAWIAWLSRMHVRRMHFPRPTAYSPETVTHKTAAPHPPPTSRHHTHTTPIPQPPFKLAKP